ncbi:MAG: DUF424 family protein [Candidatus Marsarchaeota archaeon]|jgi:hypothetical protein|nr:DUF424 family protein [Candidatus Marsarchaeota archaeon]
MRGRVSSKGSTVASPKRPKKAAGSKNRVLLKQVTSEGKTILVICESELLGQTLGTGFRVDPQYFGGQEVSVQYALDAAAAAGMVTFLGSYIVAAAVKAGLVDPYAISDLGGAKYAEVYRI